MDPQQANVLQYSYWRSDDRALIESIMAAADDALTKGKLKELPFGWNNRNEADQVMRRETDWVMAARDMFHVVIRVAHDSNYGGEELVGPLEAERAAVSTPNWIITDAPKEKSGCGGVDSRKIGSCDWKPGRVAHLAQGFANDLQP